MHQAGLLAMPLKNAGLLCNMISVSPGWGAKVIDQLASGSLTALKCSAVPATADLGLPDTEKFKINTGLVIEIRKAMRRLGPKLMDCVTRLKIKQWAMHRAV